MDASTTVFLSYSTPDRDRVQEYYDYLHGEGIDVWMDKRNLKGGQNWDVEIKRALRRAALIVVFLSDNSVDRRGYFQREIKVALDQARERLIDDIYIIPVMLSATLIPEQIAGIQVIEGADSDAYSQVAESIRIQLDRLGIETAKVQLETGIRWTKTIYKDFWDGLPGYDAGYSLIRLSSEGEPKIAEISKIIEGWLLGNVMDLRKSQLDQDTNLFNFGQDKYRRTNTWGAEFDDPVITGRMITINYTVYWYGAGAMHPNSGFQTFAFTTSPCVRVSALSDIFDDSEKALGIIRENVRKQLTAAQFEEMTADGQAIELDVDYVNSGTGTWDDFANFVFRSSGIELLFAPYQVAPYAFGPQRTLVKYEELAPLMQQLFACALEIEHLKDRVVHPDVAADELTISGEPVVEPLI